MKKNLLYGLIALAACSTGFENDQTADAVRDVEAEIKRIEAGLLPGLIIEGDSLPPMDIPRRMRFHNVPGLSIAFIENGEIKWTRTYGHLSFDSLAAVNPETRFQAASISKPVAASGLLTLVESGELDLDTDVNSYLTEWKVPENPFTETEKVTLRRLVSHNAGMTVHGFRGYAEGEEVPSTIQVLNGEVPANSNPILPDTLPGSIWRYSGGGYTVMQRVIEEQTGGSLPGFLQQAVLDPLNMDRSTYAQPLPEDKRENVAVGTRGDGQKVAGNWHTYPEIAAAGLWTTPSDLARWALAIQKSYNGSEEGILSPDMTRQMLTVQFGEYGLGPGLGGEGDSLVFRHGGANEGYRCILLAFARDGGQGVVIMTNGDRGGALFSEVLRSMDREYGWNLFKPQTKSLFAMEDAQMGAYEGTYKMGEQMTVTFSQEGRELVGLLNGERKIEFLAEGPDQFFDRDDGTPLTFIRDEDDEITGFEVQGMRFSKMDGMTNN